MTSSRDRGHVAAVFGLSLDGPPDFTAPAARALTAADVIQIRFRDKGRKPHQGAVMVFPPPPGDSRLLAWATIKAGVSRDLAIATCGTTTAGDMIAVWASEGADSVMDSQGNHYAPRRDQETIP